MPLIPNALERLVLLTANQGPGPSLDLFGAVGFRAAIAASKIGLFEALETEPDQTPSNLAKQLGLDERAVRSLMALLESLGYLRSRSGLYRLTKMSRKWMLHTSQIPHIDFLRWWHDVTFPFWDEQILDVLERGRPAVSIYDWMNDQPNAWETAQKGFEAVARQLAPMVSASVDLSGARRLLDIGGGHGLYTIELCRRYPQLEATIFDKSEALGRAQANIQSSQMQDRVKTVGGDILTSDFGHGFDTVLLFNVIHGFDRMENRRILDKARRTLEPGGRLLVLDQFQGRLPGRVSRFVLRFLEFAYLVAFSGHVYPPGEVNDWLTQTGFFDIHTTRLKRAPGMTLISAKA